MSCQICGCFLDMDSVSGQICNQCLGEMYWEDRDINCKEEYYTLSIF